MANGIHPTTLGIESVMVANTNQMRQLARNAHRWNLPYQMDFRVNTLLDSEGLHALMFDAMASTEDDLSEELIAGTSLFMRVLCYYKIVGLTADEPFTGFLTVRFRDYIWLQTPEGRLPRMYHTARAVLPRDEDSPGESDPNMWLTTGLAGRSHLPTFRQVTR